jgi:hypothetical protein
MSSQSLKLAIAGMTLLASMAPAWAGTLPTVPGPLAAVGLPALVVAGGAIWLVRKLRNRSRPL